ncbi:hypothetical protein QBC38DRAFT_457638 [Podospora fimiseda]|uniref:Uncharacterized protein n=1 Tax=Podospora fimiseda TaxID=252190 RepID=A0AAN7BK84_9PEZI|nr:hypothetical protein QBC38DRAFT_457638 [Podospora fimiseda]
MSSSSGVGSGHGDGKNINKKLDQQRQKAVFRLAVQYNQTWNDPQSQKNKTRLIEWIAGRVKHYPYNMNDFNLHSLPHAAELMAVYILNGTSTKGFNEIKAALEKWYNNLIQHKAELRERFQPTDAWINFGLEETGWPEERARDYNIYLTAVAANEDEILWRTGQILNKIYRIWPSAKSVAIDIKEAQGIIDVCGGTDAQEGLEEAGIKGHFVVKVLEECLTMAKETLPMEHLRDFLDLADLDLSEEPGELDPYGPLDVLKRKEIDESDSASDRSGSGG